MLRENDHLRIVGAVLRLDGEHVVSPPRPARPIRHSLPGVGMLLHVGQHSVERGQTRRVGGDADLAEEQDRKSTRLNSSHGYISYAVFCLKKKNQAALPRYVASVAAYPAPFAAGWPSTSRRPPAPPPTPAPTLARALAPSHSARSHLTTDS